MSTHEDKRAFKKAFLWTAVPIVALSIVSTAGVGDDTDYGGSFWFGFYFVWYGAAGLALIAVLGAVGFAVARKGRAASGILAGIGIGVLALALTCFANLSTLEI